MGKMGEAANLGAVAIAAFIVLKLSGLKLPKFELPKFPEITLPFDIDVIDVTRERDSDYYRRQLDEHSSNLENILAFDPFPEIPPVDIKPTSYYEDVSRYHAGRIEHYREVSDVLVPGIESQLEALQANVAELGSMVGGEHDAGGSTDITPYHEYASRLAGRYIPL